MPGKVIGKKLPYGFVGKYARQGDMIVSSHQLGSAVATYGDAVYWNPTTKTVVTAADNSANSLGVPIGLIGYEAHDSYNDSGDVLFQKGDIVPVFIRGSIIAPVLHAGLGVTLYYHIKDGATVFTTVEEAADGDVVVPSWMCNSDDVDANGNCEIVLLERKFV